MKKIFSIIFLGFIGNINSDSEKHDLIIELSPGGESGQGHTARFPDDENFSPRHKYENKILIGKKIKIEENKLEISKEFLHADKFKIKREVTLSEKDSINQFLKFFFKTKKYKYPKCFNTEGGGLFLTIDSIRITICPVNYGPGFDSNAAKMEKFGRWLISK